MKFIVVVLMLALAVSAQAGLVPLNSYTVPYTAYTQTYPVTAAHFPIASPNFRIASPNIPIVSPHFPVAAAPLHSTFYSSWPFDARSLPLTYATGSIPLHFENPQIVHSIPALRAISYRSPAHAPIASIAPSDGTYTAVNQGAVHVAPLPGHSKSISSVNL